MSNAQDLDRETIHRRARDYAEMRTILEVATSQELAQDPKAIVDLFFRAYDEFAAHISGQQFERPRLVAAETIPIVQKLALQATIARFSGKSYTSLDDSIGLNFPIRCESCFGKNWGQQGFCVLYAFFQDV